MMIDDNTPSFKSKLEDSIFLNDAFASRLSTS
jgi:hypothetical protein